MNHKHDQVVSRIRDLKTPERQKTRTIATTNLKDVSSPDYAQRYIDMFRPFYTGSKITKRRKG